MKKTNNMILNDLKTFNKLKDITLEEDKTIMIDDSLTSSSFDTNKFLIKFKTIVRKTVNSIFPPKCYICGKNNPNAEFSNVCDDCKTVYKQYEVNKEFLDDKEKVIGLGIYRYDSIVRFFVQKMKYRKDPKIAMALGELSIQKAKEFLNKHHVNYIIPIPIHKDRLKERGFNQSEIIAKIISEKTGIQMRTDLIERSKYTVPQSKLKNEERKENVKDSFKILNENEIWGKDIILIDDVYTTGSTIEECSRVLYEHNTRKVYFLSINVSNNQLKGECNYEN